MATEKDQDPREAAKPGWTEEEAEEAQEHPALEGAAEEEAGILHDEPVEGGDELSIGGGPPSGAGGTRGTPLPTHDDLHQG
jgi:hypothetical protein